MFDLIVEGASVWAQIPIQDIIIRDEQIVAIGPTEHGMVATRHLPASGGLVLPGLVNIHTHLDKAFLANRILNMSGTIAEARQRMKDAKAGFTTEDVTTRAKRAIHQSVQRGVTAIRSHVDIDPAVGLRSVEAMLGIQETLRPIVDLQIVAFPQEGIIDQPGTEDLMREALRMGVDVVGGHLSIAKTPEILKAETDVVFRLATAFDRDIDVHVDLDIDRDYGRIVTTHADRCRYPDALGAVYLAEKTIAEGYEGRVTASHLCALDIIPPDLRANVIELMRRANVAVVALPASNLYIHGRADQINTRRGVTRVRELRASGVRVAVGTDNIRDPFLPFGNTDLIQNAVVAALACHLVTAEEFLDMLRMHTVTPAEIMRLYGYGLQEGCHADLVVFKARSLDDLLDGETNRRWVVKRGRLVAETEIISRLHPEVDSDC